VDIRSAKENCAKIESAFMIVVNGHASFDVTEWLLLSE